MPAKIDSPAQSPGREFTISRVFDAPRALVFKAWTEADQLAQWFCPKGCVVRVAKMDPRPGGMLLTQMRMPDGHEMWGKWAIREVTPPQRLVFVNSFSDKNGGITRHPLSPTWPLEMLTTVIFVQEGEKTRINLTWVPINPTPEERKTFDAGFDSMNKGWGGTFEQLVACLAQQPQAHGTDPDALPTREITITRIFDAPPAMVFKAWTDPKQLARWWGPKGFTNPVCEADARVGGKWHIVMRAPDGSEYPCRGVYREIIEPQRLVFTNIAIDKDGNPIIDGLTTVIFDEENGKTKLTLQTRGTAVVAYAAAYLKGMETGWTQSIERLAAELAKAP
jgi:uncharacterized protein YndB with AHSA1/START domain